METFEQLALWNKVLAVIPAAGAGYRMTPRWTITDPLQDAVAKPAMKELSTGKTFLDLIFDTLLDGKVVKQILVRVGHRPKPLIECKSDLDKIKYQHHADLTGIVEKRHPIVQAYYSNANGRDDGTGATVVAQEAKEFLQRHPEYEYILILASDIPTIPAAIFKSMLLDHIQNKRDMTVASVIEEVPDNYGRIVRHPETGEFIAVVEQLQIGKTPEERKGAISFPGLDYPLAKKSLHRIKERNVLLEIINRDIFLNTIRDIDAPNYARIVRDELGNELGVISNQELQYLPEQGTYRINQYTYTRSALSQIIECRKIAEIPSATYVLERHQKNEYYLPELAMQVKAQHKIIGIYPLPNGIAEGLDSRTDLRYYAMKKNQTASSAPIDKQLIAQVTSQHLSLLSEQELQVLEQVFGVTVYPGTEIYVDKPLYKFLSDLTRLITKIGSTKDFCEIYYHELRSGSWNRIPGLAVSPSFEFALGVHTSFKNLIGLAGKISIAPWAILSNCLVQDSEVKRKQSLVNQMLINNSLKEVVA
ncbi:MAG: hypothetical protein ACE14V_11315 [bacterium]